MTPTLDQLADAVSGLYAAAGRPVPWLSVPPVPAPVPVPVANFDVPMQATMAPGVVFVHDSSRPTWTGGGTVQRGRTMAFLVPDEKSFVISNGSTSKTISLAKDTRQVVTISKASDWEGKTFGDDTRIVFAANVTIKTNATLDGRNIIVDGKQFVVSILARADRVSLFDSTPGCKNTIIRDLAVVGVDSAGHKATDTVIFGYVRGELPAIVNCSVGNTAEGFSFAYSGDGQYFANNTDTGTINRQFLYAGWDGPTDPAISWAVYTGNTSTHASLTENNYRISGRGINHLGFYANVCKNKGKSSFTLRTVKEADVIGCKFAGAPAGIGPQTVNDRAQDVYVAECKFDMAHYEIGPGVVGPVLVENNSWTMTDTPPIHLTDNGGTKLPGLNLVGAITVTNNTATMTVAGKPFVRKIYAPTKPGEKPIEEFVHCTISASGNKISGKDAGVA